jgi:hypothetical protein
MTYSSEWSDLVSKFGFGYVTDEEQYRHIVKVRAYTDMQPRTIEGLGEFRNKPTNRQKLDELFNALAKTLYKFVVNDPTKSKQEFDDWHKTTCEWFVNEFNAIINGYGVDKIAFGKAQKIINVSFKYIYCLKGADEYKSKFEHCHMVLDRFTYSEGFYLQEVIPWYNKENMQTTIKRSDLKSWSNLEFYDYNTIQNNIFDYLSNTNIYIDAMGRRLTPFQAEFYIYDKYSA